jgi:hypothetical protein
LLILSAAYPEPRQKRGRYAGCRLRNGDRCAHYAECPASIQSFSSNAVRNTGAWLPLGWRVSKREKRKTFGAKRGVQKHRCIRRSSRRRGQNRLDASSPRPEGVEKGSGQTRPSSSRGGGRAKEPVMHRYVRQRSRENAEIADWLMRLTAPQPQCGFDSCYFYLRHVKGFGLSYKRVYRIYQEMELSLFRIKPPQCSITSLLFCGHEQVSRTV